MTTTSVTSVYIFWVTFYNLNDKFLYLFTETQPHLRYLKNSKVFVSLQGDQY